MFLSNTQFFSLKFALYHVTRVCSTIIINFPSRTKFFLHFSDLQAWENLFVNEVQVFHWQFQYFLSQADNRMNSKKF